jgi:predicted dinucleotide-binding enzyme
LPCIDFENRTLLDVTNPLTLTDGRLQLAIGFEDSGGETVARLAPTARVVKTLNQVGFEVMSAARKRTIKPVMFAASEHTESKAMAMSLLDDLGFDARDAGDLKQSRLLEPLAMLWIKQSLEFGMPSDTAFALTRAFIDQEAL